MTTVQNRIQRPGLLPAQARTKVAVVTRPPGFYAQNVLIDASQLGAARPGVNSDGLWTLDLVPSGDLFPAGSFYEAIQQVDDMASSWPFVVPGPITFTDGFRHSNVVTLTGLPAGHGVQIGDTLLTVDAADAGYDGTGFVVTESEPTTISYPQTAADDPSAGAGTITKTWDLAELVNQWFVQATWGGLPVTWGGEDVMWSVATALESDPLLVTVRDVARLPGGAPLWDRIRLDLRMRQGGFYGAPDQTEILGTRRIHPDSTGAWTLQLVPNAGTAPEGSYYELTETVGREVTVRRFRVPPAWNIIDSQRVGNVVTATVDTPLTGVLPFDNMTVDLGDSSYDGTFFVTGPTDDFHLTWSQTGADDAEGGTGTINKLWDLADLIEFYSVP